MGSGRSLEAASILLPIFLLLPGTSTLPFLHLRLLSQETPELLSGPSSTPASSLKAADPLKCNLGHATQVETSSAFSLHGEEHPSTRVAKGRLFTAPRPPCPSLMALPFLLLSLLQPTPLPLWPSQSSLAPCRAQSYCLSRQRPWSDTPEHPSSPGPTCHLGVPSKHSLIVDIWPHLLYLFAYLFLDFSSKLLRDLSCLLPL